MVTRLQETDLTYSVALRKWERVPGEHAWKTEVAELDGPKSGVGTDWMQISFRHELSAIFDAHTNP